MYWIKNDGTHTLFGKPVGGCHGSGKKRCRRINNLQNDRAERNCPIPQMFVMVSASEHSVESKGKKRNYIFAV